MDRRAIAVAVGLLASGTALFVLVVGGRIAGYPLFEGMLPSTVIVKVSGLGAGALPAPVQLLFGGTVAFVIGDIYGPSTRLVHGLAVGIGIWLLNMLVFSPFFGWGIFCLAGHPSLTADVPPYLAGGLLYAGISLLLHLLYGAIVGVLLGHLLGD